MNGDELWVMGEWHAAWATETWACILGHEDWKCVEENQPEIKVQQSIDMVCVKMEKFYQSIWDKIEQDDAVIRGMIEEFEVGSGISEKTLLRALEIVTKDKQQS